MEWKIKSSLLLIYIHHDFYITCFTIQIHNLSIYTITYIVIVIINIYICSKHFNIIIMFKPFLVISDWHIESEQNIDMF